MNIGYAASWIFNILKSTKETLNTVYFLKLSIDTWENCSPPRAERMKKLWNSLKVDKQTKTEVNKLPDWKLINKSKEISKIGVKNNYKEKILS